MSIKEERENFNTVRETIVPAHAFPSKAIDDLFEKAAS